MKYGFGVDLGGTSVKLAYFDQEGHMLSKWEIPTDISQCGKNILPDIAKSINGYIEKNRIDRASLLGIGMGVPGPINEEGVVNECHNLGWGVFNLHQELSALTGLPVKGGNDANVAALGECWKGGGANCRDMVLITLGTGIGGGIVVGGNVIAGVHGAGGEIGHLILDRNETEYCNCGNRGCAEQYGSATGIVRLAKKHLADPGCASPLKEIEALTCKDIFDAAKDGDKDAIAILDLVYSYLGQLAANMSNVLDPEVIVFGGGVSKAGQTLLDGIYPYFQKNVFRGAKDTRFALATLGNDAGAYGAFKLALLAFGT